MTRFHDVALRYGHIVRNLARCVRPLCLVAAFHLTAFGICTAEPQPCAAHQRAYPSPYPFGILDRFYRGMQLQSLYDAEGLMPIPAYLLGSDIDIRYRKNPKLREEVPFADRLSFSRFLGGYSAPMLQRAGRWDASLGVRSEDYVTRGPSGKLQFAEGFAEKKLSPYLAAGYSLSDFTLSLSNIPWDLAAGGGREGPWGQQNPAASWVDWSTVVAHFVQDIAHAWPGTKPPRYELGVEYDSEDSFTGSEPSYFQYYAATAKAVAAASPGSEFSPGEFTGRGECRDHSRCVYDTRDLIDYARKNGLRIDSVPRSLHLIQGEGDAMPSTAILRAKVSYGRLPGIVPEVHQMGLLGQPFLRDKVLPSRDVGARQAAWEFQMLMLLKSTIYPRLVNHWGTFEKIGKNGTPLMNGSGFTHLLLDRYLGARMIELPFDAGDTSGSEILPVLFKGTTGTALVVTSFTPGTVPAKVSVTVDADGLSGPVGQWRILRYNESGNVFFAIRARLEAANDLNPEFSACADCVATPMAMGASSQQTRAVVASGTNDFIAIIKKGLRFQRAAAAPGAAINGNKIRLTMEGNEIAVLETGTWQP